MEVKKFQDLLVKKPRRANCISSSPRGRRSPEAEEDQCPSSKTVRQRDTKYLLF
jgi:hypothetical protein